MGSLLYIDISKLEMRVSSLFSGLLLLLPALVLAQPGGATPLTLEQAAGLMLQNHPELRALRMEEEAADYAFRATAGLRLPSLSVTALYAYLPNDLAADLNPLKPQVSGAIGSFLPSLPPSLAESLLPAVSPKIAEMMAKDWKITLQENQMGIVGSVLTFPIYTGGKIGVARRAARLKLDAAGLKGTQQLNSLYSQLIERYYGLLLASEVLEVRKEVLKAMRQHLHDAALLEANGAIARGEKLYAESVVAEAEKEVTKAELTLRSIQRVMQNILYTSGNWTPVSPLFVLDASDSLPRFLADAMAHNPLLKQVELQAQLAGEGVKLHRADYLPQVAVTGMARLADYQLMNGMPRWVAGAGLKMNLFDGFQRENRYKEAKAKVRQVEAVLEQAADNVETLVEKLYLDMHSEALQLPALESALAFAREYLRMKEMLFAEGAATSIDVVDARLNVARLQIERLQAAYRFDLLLAKLLEACGQSTEFVSYSRQPGVTAVMID